MAMGKTVVACLVLAALVAVEASFFTGFNYPVPSPPVNRYSYPVPAPAPAYRYPQPSPAPSPSPPPSPPAMPTYVFRRPSPSPPSPAPAPQPAPRYPAPVAPSRPPTQFGYGPTNPSASLIQALLSQLRYKPPPPPPATPKPPPPPPPPQPTMMMMNPALMQMQTIFGPKGPGGDSRQCDDFSCGPNACCEFNGNIYACVPTLNGQCVRRKRCATNGDCPFNHCCVVRMDNPASSFMSRTVTGFGTKAFDPHSRNKMEVGECVLSVSTRGSACFKPVPGENTATCPCGMGLNCAFSATNPLMGTCM